MINLISADRLNGCVCWQSPSNIAIVKYWGKFENQIPMNASISMTLSESFSQTTIDYSPKLPNGKVFEFLFNNLPQPSFEAKLSKILDYAIAQYPVLANCSFKISSFNTFPHSAGIASSASSMSALALCFAQISNQIQGLSTLPNDNSIGHLARLGSGSACRSLHAGWALWGEHKAVDGSSNLHAVSINKLVHSYFSNYADAILVLDEKKKSVSSTAGHQLMDNHPYQKGRVEQANRNVTLLLNALKTGDVLSFISICEEEALSLHALMMSSNPGFMLIKPSTLVAIEKIRMFRRETSIPICFTLDAGPNIHLLYPLDCINEVDGFINSELKPLCHNELVIYDKIGLGPKAI